MFSSDLQFNVFFSEKSGSRDIQSRLHMSYKKIVPENFGKSIGKHICWSLFISNVASILQRS